jgi:hypothetical protein
MRAMEPETWRPRDQPLIALKDAKGVKDCSAAERAIFANIVRSMCARPIHREHSGKLHQQREMRDSAYRRLLVPIVSLVSIVSTPRVDQMETRGTVAYLRSTPSAVKNRQSKASLCELAS